VDNLYQFVVAFFVCNFVHCFEKNTNFLDYFFKRVKMENMEILNAALFPVCPFCDQSSFEEKGANLFCNTCAMFIGAAVAMPRLNTIHVLAPARRRAARDREYMYRQQVREAENEWWYGLIFTLFLGTASLAILGVL